MRPQAHEVLNLTSYAFSPLNSEFIFGDRVIFFHGPDVFLRESSVVIYTLLSYTHKPIFKKGAKQDPNNYRPVSLTVALCKVMEHVIYRSIMQHLEHNNILYSKQHGFRRNHSCETQLLLTIEDLGRIWMRDMKLIYRFLNSVRPLTRYPTRDYSPN